MGLTGGEHGSMRRPTAGRASGEAAEREYLERVQDSKHEAWRRERMIAHFTRPLSLGHILDLFTSVLLWVEEIHNLNYAVNDATGLRKAEPCSVLYKKVPSRERLRPMKTTRHTINVPAEMEQLLNDRIRDFRSLSAYFVSLCFTDLLYLPKRPIAKAFDFPS